ncbi:MAG: energy transducer TonB [Thermovirgaceae bacterium]|jgi:protein TonB|nr:energy transducer TonB [Synergistales bacterium]MDD4024088.1 energy transducer TonB [Synergistales bacterium]
MKKWLLFLVVSLCLHFLVLGLGRSPAVPEVATPSVIVLELEMRSVPHSLAPAESNPTPPVPATATQPVKEALAERKPVKTKPLAPSEIPTEDEKSEAAPERESTASEPQEVPTTVNEAVSSEERAHGDAIPREVAASDVIDRVRPLYPLASRRRGEEGEVRILVKLGPGGELLSVEVVNSSGYPSLDGSALAAVKKWRFSPRSPEELIVPFIFRLE